jgi:hypothetical protein
MFSEDANQYTIPAIFAKLEAKILSLITTEPLQLLRMIAEP